jgi:hypothetical protein
MFFEHQPACWARQRFYRKYMFLKNFMEHAQARANLESGRAAQLPRPVAIALDVLLAPLLLCAVVWVVQRQASILRNGVPLNDAQRELASALGIGLVERVRVVSTQVIPMPLPLWARGFVQRAGWASQHIAGMTLGHGIVMREDYADDMRLLAHELVHVSQYERLGGIAGFLRHYLRECVWPGYPHGELEREARAVEARCSAQRADVIPYHFKAADWMAPPRIL